MGSFRKNVATLITHKGLCLACHRTDIDTWQCVQGGVESSDTDLYAALKRELSEELGLKQGGYQILKQSSYWRRYLFPPQFDFRFGNDCIGQEQRWFHVELLDPAAIDLHNSQHEFDRVDWVSTQKLYDLFSPFKKPVFQDFCYELGLLPR